MSRRPGHLGGIVALVLGTALVPGPTGPASAAEPGSPLVLMSQPTVTAYALGKHTYSDLGVRLVAPGERVEVRAHRPADYAGPITTELSVGDDDPVALDTTMKDFRGIPGFLSVEVRRASDGTRVLQRRFRSCLNGFQSQRIRPDAPATSPYPAGCPANSYALGSVMGIQAGHAVNLLDSGTRLPFGPGRYDVTARLSATWAEALGIAPEDAVTTSRLVVANGNVTGRQDPRTATPQPAAQEPDGTAPPLPADAPLPDLRALPAWQVELNYRGTRIDFAATMWNAGNSPLVVDGFRRPGEEVMEAYQYFFDAEGNEVSWTPEPIGELTWHAANHDHWHFEDAARYRILDADLSQVVRSRKQSFCMANSDAIDYTVEGADWSPPAVDLETACDGRDAVSRRQILSPGSGDTYFQYRAGQSFDVKDLPNGQYWISVETNPLGTLTESDTTNNSSLRKIWLKGKGTNRRVVVDQVGVIEHEHNPFR